MGGGCCGVGVPAAARCLGRRLAELVASLERLRAEDEEKERAAQGLRLQLQQLVSAGRGSGGGGGSRDVGGV